MQTFMTTPRYQRDDEEPMTTACRPAGVRRSHCLQYLWRDINHGSVDIAQDQPAGPAKMCTVLQ